MSSNLPNAQRGGTPEQASEKPSTRKMNLDRAYMYEGTVYGPGLTEVPDDGTADSLEAAQQRLQNSGRPAPIADVVYDQNPRPRMDQVSPTGSVRSNNDTTELDPGSQPLKGAPPLVKQVDKEEGDQDPKAAQKQGHHTSKVPSKTDGKTPTKAPADDEDPDKYPEKDKDSKAKK